jgi:hypothetical protein
MTDGQIDIRETEIFEFVEFESKDDVLVGQLLFYTGKVDEP